MIKKLALGSLLLAFSQLTQAGTLISGQFGKTFSQALTTEEGLKLDLHDNNHFGISIERTITGARYGLYYASLDTHLQNQSDKQLDMNLYSFQSAVELPIREDISGYFGAHVGINNIKPNWSESDSFFALGLYGGVEYQFTPAARVSFETRWVNTIIDNNSSVSCDGTTEDDQCLWHFDGDVLTQFQTSLGFSYRF